MLQEDETFKKQACQLVVQPVPETQGKMPFAEVRRYLEWLKHMTSQNEEPQPEIKDVTSFYQKHVFQLTLVKQHVQIKKTDEIITPVKKHVQVEESIEED